MTNQTIRSFIFCPTCSMTLNVTNHVTEQHLGTAVQYVSFMSYSACTNLLSLRMFEEWVTLTRQVSPALSAKLVFLLLLLQRWFNHQGWSLNTIGRHGASIYQIRFYKSFCLRHSIKQVKLWAPDWKWLYNHVSKTTKQISRFTFFLFLFFSNRSVNTSQQ